MRSTLTAGALAGLLAGLVFGMMMQMMNAPTPDGGRMPMMAMVAMVVRSDSLAIGWLYHLFNSAAEPGWTFTLVNYFSSSTEISRNGLIAVRGQHTSGKKGIVLIRSPITP